MEIQELPSNANSEVILSILEPFKFSEEKQSLIKRNFECEMTEIGSNRIVLLGSASQIPMATVQLVLTNADNNPELANGWDIAHVHNLWVRKDHHRRGLAGCMMRYCEKLASQKRIKYLTLGVDDDNNPALSLYEKLGYKKFAEEEGRTPHEKLLLMRKAL